PGFPAVRAVEHLEDGSGLALVSTHVPGRRLSEMFQSPQPRAGLHPAFVTWLIRQLTSSLAALQAQGEQVVHGAMSADRVIVGADGRLLIAEHVLGSALHNLRLTPSLLANEFGVLAPPTKTGLARIDARTDVIQLGLIALSVLLGRQISYDTYQQDLRPLVEEFSAGAKQPSPCRAPALRLWLERALQLDKYAFGSAAEARDGLKELPNTASPHESATGQSSVLVDRPGGDALTHIRSSSRSGGSTAASQAAAAPAATRGTAPVAFQASTGPRLTAPVIPRITSQPTTRTTVPLEPVPPEKRRGAIATHEDSSSDQTAAPAPPRPPLA